MLQSLGVPDDRIEAELLAIDPMVGSTTASRTILGSMIDFIHILFFSPRDAAMFEVARDLAKSPCSPIGIIAPTEQR